VRGQADDDNEISGDNQTTGSSGARATTICREATATTS
jgi:hypothetical protein